MKSVIFEDSFEEWEQNAIDGRGVGPRIMLSVVWRDKQSCFRLQEKYKGLFFVDKDPDGDNDYYVDDGAEARPSNEWEHRKIVGLIWANHSGWRVETKLASDLTGPSTNYLINEALIQMISESRRNRNIILRSNIPDDP